MANAKTQNFENHARIVFLYHRVAFGILAVNLIWSIYRVSVTFSLESLLAVLMAIALLILFLYARLFAITVQDRVIRLEMQLRLERVLPADLRARMKELGVGQLVSLRFASDEEMPDLVGKVLSENLTDRKAIKRMIRNWQPDLLRA